MKVRFFPSLPYAHLAQSVVHSAVNRVVVGSSPTVGANTPQEYSCEAMIVGIAKQK